MNLIELSVQEFTQALADDSPAPGGGSVVALAGAMSAGLAAMVARMTMGKIKYQDKWAAMERMAAEADRLRTRFLSLVVQDTEAYNRVIYALKMPKASDDQKAVRSQAIQQAKRLAAEVPLETLAAMIELVDLVEQAVEHGNPNCLTDAGVAAGLIHSAALGAAYNVRINLGGIKDEAYVKKLQIDVKRLLGAVLLRAGNLGKIVDMRLR